MLTCLLTASCILPAPSPDLGTDARPWIVIRKDQADPPLPGTYLWDVNTNAVTVFQLRKVETGFMTTPLQYFWYYDLPESPPVLESFTVCGSPPVCKLQLCVKANSTDPDHNLLVVVSNGPLKANPMGPYDFEPGVVFDSVEWHIKKAGPCK